MTDTGLQASGAGPEVAVVGGGILGVRLALRLAEGGAAVTVFEAGERLGGLVRPWRLGDLTWDRFYHVILMSDQRTRGLVDELGLGPALRFSTTRTGFYVDGRQHSVSTALEFLRFPGLGWPGKLRLGATLAGVGRLPGGAWLEARGVLEFLGAWSGRQALDRVWRPLLQAKLGDGHAEASAAFIHATIRRLSAARRAGLAREAFGYVSGGWATVLERLEIALPARGVKLRLGCPVQAVLPGGGVRTARGLEPFDGVVITAAPPTALRLLGEAPPPAVRRRLAAVEMLGVICASVLLDRPLHDYYVTNITDASPFTGIIDMSALVDPVELGGRGLVYLPRYLPLDHPLWGADDAEIQATFLGALEAMYPDFNRGRVQAFGVARAREVMAVPSLGYSARRLPPLDPGVEGVWLACSAQILNGTLNVDETLGLADAQAPRILAALASKAPR